MTQRNNEFDVNNVKRVIQVPLEYEDEQLPVSVILVEDIHGTQSFWYEDHEGEVEIPQYTDDEWELFDQLIYHVGW